MKTYNRLVAFGDSFTYGEHLPDNLENSFDSPSEYSWPNVIAKSLDVPCVNLALPGGSNKYIANSILDFEFKKGDIILILWSWHNRFHVFDNRLPVGSKIGTWNIRNKKYSDAYYKHIYNEFDSIKQSVIYINHTNDYLKTKKIKHFHALLDSDIKDYLKTCSFNRTEFMEYNVDFIDFANDGRHPGIKSQHQMAKTIWLNIKGQLKND